MSDINLSDDELLVIVGGYNEMNKFLTIVDLVVAMDVEVDAEAVLLSL